MRVRVLDGCVIRVLDYASGALSVYKAGEAAQLDSGLALEFVYHGFAEAE